MESKQTNDLIIKWLWVGIIMVIFQIFLGGITRLTGSGLSITHWDIITGVLYPFSEQQWNYYFDLYKQTPQYLKINDKMDLSAFKFIFFWEYIHRLWARLMGFVFVLPLAYFLYKKWVPKSLYKNLIVIFLLAVFVASLGWIMVASGFVNHPWVNAYKLSFHLLAAVLLLCYLFVTILKLKDPVNIIDRPKIIDKSLGVLIILVLLQILLGGVMAGMKASLIAPTWPTINGNFFPPEIFRISSYTQFLFSEYELSHTGPVIIQFFHRMCAYIIFILIFILCIIFNRNYKNYSCRPIYYLILLCFFQIVLGVLTLVNSVGYIPVWSGSLHQIGGIILLLYLLKLYFSFQLQYKSKNLKL
ncbi:MAG: COX15/CtaA family protein [Saprospiraceae bacterium]|nr:COX15/CtaA family protein [Saprospiraceae bacterium]